MTDKILALKYRPQQFRDLIGQEVLVKTIENGIKLKKTPNAYLLTGIRGVGKTTTARLIAKALNCTKNFSAGEKCNPTENCHHCKEIADSKHMDVLEMDAASKTGIDDIRELIENSKYSPTSAKFKIFIIDEVHMLSKQAFNGLLKTLEEPPPRLKFILATTEVRKIPVTILSRCQRFDLKRVSISQISEHIKNIAKKEKGNISEDAIKLLARASEGSVRDSISLLDRILISQTNDERKIIEENDVREMLGLADKTKLISMFGEILKGNEKNALNYLKEFINNGLEAKNFLNDILEIIYLFSRSTNLGPIKNDMSISEAEIKMIEQFSDNIKMVDLGLFWQLTIKTIDDLRIVGDENLILEMFIIQLIHLQNIEEEEIKSETIDNSNNTGEIISDKNIDKKKLETVLTNQAKNQLKNTDQIKTNLIKDTLVEKKKTKINITSFKDLIALAFKEKEIELSYDLERNVKLVSFNKGKIDISFNEKLNKNFIKNLTEKLLFWTGERWIISLSKNAGAKSVYEKKIEDKNTKLEKVKKDKFAQDILSKFPDAELIDVIGEKND